MKFVSHVNHYRKIYVKIGQWALSVVCQAESAKLLQNGLIYSV